MSRSTLTSKGQITLPRMVREALRLGTGDRVAFEIRPDGTVEMRAEAGDVLALYGSLKSRRQRAVTLEEMERAIRAGGARA